MDKLAKHITANLDKITWTRSQNGTVDGDLGLYTIRCMAKDILIADTTRPNVWAWLRNEAMIEKLKQCSEEWFVAELTRLLPDDTADSVTNQAPQTIGD